MSAAARLAGALRDNRAAVHGPLAQELAAPMVASLLDGCALVAVPPGDPLVAALQLEPVLREAGISVLTPDDPTWATRLPEAGAGITGALLGVVDTGTLVVAAGPGAPRATSLLPPRHVCLVRVADLVETVADALGRLAANPLPSALTWIGGPSRTADLEMRPTWGVHGPEALDVVLVE